MNLFGSDDHREEPELFEDLPPDPVSESQARASLHGKEFDAEAFEFVEGLGARIVERYTRVLGYPMDALLEGANGSRYYLDAHGTPDRSDRSRAGMRRQDTMLKFGFKALRLRDRDCPYPVLLITSHMPKVGTSSSFLLTEIADALWDAVAIVGDVPGQQRLHAYFHDKPAPTAPLSAPWRAVQLSFDSDVFDTIGEADDRDA